MAELVPGPGWGLAVQVAGATPTVSRLGPFAAGTYIERLAVAVYLRTQTLATGLRLGFGVSAGLGVSFENFLASSKVWHPRSVTGAWESWYRLEFGTGEGIAFDVDVGVFVDTGSLWVLVYHDLEDGTDYHDLFVSVKTSVVAKRLPVVL